jgi:hypothetical protein
MPPNRGIEQELARRLRMELDQQSGPHPTWVDNRTAARPGRRTPAVRPWLFVAVTLVLGSGLLVGLLLASGANPGSSAFGSSSPTSTLATGDNVPTPASSCGVTVPDRAFVPPSPFESQPPAEYHALWYGTADLWTMLDPQGAVWFGLPHESNGLVQKTVWYSSSFSVTQEPQPAISVSGQRLDLPGSSFKIDPPGTNGTDLSGDFMLVGIVLPSAGCWEIRAAYHGHTLAYTVWVPG